MIDLPLFKLTKRNQEHVQDHRLTASALRSLWWSASVRVRRDPEFLQALLRATWVGTHAFTDRARITRNRYWARWLGVRERTNTEELAKTLSRRLTGLSDAAARRHVNTHTGMTLYYSAFRPRTVSFVRRHRSEIAKAAAMVARTERDPIAKVRRVAPIVDDLPVIRTPNGGTVSCFSGLSPLLACLDPQRRFPVMNERTTTLLRVLELDQDAEGAAALPDIVGKFGIRDNIDLDVYAYTHADGIFRVTRRARKRSSPVSPVRHIVALGEKSEQTGVAELAKKRITIRRLHNELTNRFRKAVRWRHRLRQSAADILIENWRSHRWLIIEAKTSTSGPAGRAQLRLAIGHLFDYRLMYFADTSQRVDLALLTPHEPKEDVVELLDRLGMQSLWFNGQKLTGTVDLLKKTSQGAR